ncbi:MAG: 2-hydroxyacid dehydrogenase [Paracoccaceae bacterium]
MPDKPRMMVFGQATAHMHGRLAEVFEVLQPAPDDRAQVLAEQGAGIAYAMLVGHVPIGADVLDQLPDLKILSNFGVGYDAIDTAAAIERGVLVTHTPDVLNDEVANTAILLMLAVARDMVRDEAYVRAGRWATEGAAPLSRSVKGLTVGIVGFGRIGQAIAEKLTVFGTRTVYHARSDKGVEYEFYASLSDMARDSDILIAITPGGAETRHLINSDVIEALGPQGILINVARGSVVDETALIAALQDGRLGAAGLDVFEKEPHVPADLIALPNVTLLPHVGSATVETRQAMGDLAVDNLLRFRETGQAVTPVPECKTT